MSDPLATSRPRHESGIPVRLADGRIWLLAPPSALRDDPALDAVLTSVAEADDLPERLRAELALGIFLLTRNYELSSSELDALLRFNAHRERREAFAAALGEVAQAALSARPVVHHGADAATAPRGEKLGRWIRALWPLGTS